MGIIFCQVMFFAGIMIEVKQVLASFQRPPNIFAMAIGQRMKRLRRAVTSRVLEMEPFPDDTLFSAQYGSEVDSVHARGSFGGGEGQQRDLPRWCRPSPDDSSFGTCAVAASTLRLFMQGHVFTPLKDSRCR